MRTTKAHETRRRTFPTRKVHRRSARPDPPSHDLTRNHEARNEARRESRRKNGSCNSVQIVSKEGMAAKAARPTHPMDLNDCSLSTLAIVRSPCHHTHSQPPLVRRSRYADTLARSNAHGIPHRCVVVRGSPCHIPLWETPTSRALRSNEKPSRNKGVAATTDRPLTRTIAK